MIEKRIQRLQQRVNKLNLKDQNLAGWRTLIFILAFVLWCFVGLDVFPKLFLPLSVLASLAFFILVYVHRKIRHSLRLFQSRLKLEERQLAINSLKWKEIPQKEFSGDNKTPYLTDLNITGEFSVLRLMDHTNSKKSYETLLDLFLSNSVANDEIARRHQLVGEIHKSTVFRNVYLTHMGVQPKAIDTQKINELLREPLSEVKSPLAFILIAIIQLVFLTAMIGAFFGYGNKTVLILSFVFLLLENVRLRKKVKTASAYGWSVSSSYYLDSFRTAVRQLEKFSKIKKPELRKLLNVFSAGNSVSAHLQKLESISGALGVRQNFIVHALVHLFVPWDILWTFLLDKRRSQIHEKLPVWEKAFTEFEAFLSIAMYKAANPQFVEPTITKDATIVISSQNLRHPLLDKDVAVGNPIEISEKEKCILITGSNMSGKSTFMRSVGVNYILAKAGCSVAADSFEFSNRQLYSSLSGGDSLQEGLSSFYAEVKRLKDILEVSRKGTKVLFLIDEIFRGTNNRERLIGSQAYIKELVSLDAKGIVTSHDLELSNLESLNIGIINYHFKETIKDSEMFFSYEKQRGPCPTTNALEVMKLNGLPV